MLRSFRYYYQHMNKGEQEIYEAMLSCFYSLSTSVKVPVPDGGRGFGDIFFKLKLDNPDIFYVTGYGYRVAAGAENAEFLPQYMFDRQKVKEHRQAIEARVQKLTRPAEKLSDVEKEKYIHDFICENVKYDKLKKSYSHEIIGPLQNGVGVCEGIAKTVKLMCDRLGLECIVAISEADPETPNGYLHAWNVIKLAGGRYHMDATFDNSLGRYGGIRYDYFNLGDKQIFRDHRPLLYPVPACVDVDAFYYKTMKLSWTKTEDVLNRVSQAIRKKKDGLVFHWRGGYLTREKLAEIVLLIDAAARGKDRGVKYSVNFPQAVIKLSFTEPDTGAEIETEYADEGESVQ